MFETKWQDAVAKAAHYKAIGLTKIYLSRSDDMPWFFATEIEEGSMHRLNISVSVGFVAEHPCGLTFFWSLDLETRDANGKGTYSLDGLAISVAYAKLPEKIRRQFAARLVATADAVHAKGEEIQEAAAKQFAQAYQLRTLIATALVADQE